MLTHEMLKAAGYTRFGREACGGTYADALWQKRVRDGSGATRYFLNVFEYEMTLLDSSTRWQPQLDLRLDRQREIRITLIGDDDLASIEAFAAMAYERLGAVPWEAP